MKGIRVGDVVTRKGMEGIVCYIETINDEINVLVQVTQPQDFEGHDGNSFGEDFSDMEHFYPRKMWWFNSCDLRISRRQDENLI